MRFIDLAILFLLSGLYCTNCGPTISVPPVTVVSSPRLSSPAAAEYPVVEYGTFETFTTDDGTGALAVVYRDEAGHLAQRYFYVCYASHDGCGGRMILDTVDLPAGALVPGTPIVITRTGDTAYAIAKVKED